MSLIRTICLGTLAGLAGSAAMHGFRLSWERFAVRDERDTVFGFDREADLNAARLNYQLFSNEFLPDRQATRLGLAMHYAFGPMLGILYAATRCRNGVLFGALLWVFADEIPISALSISNPREKSAASHASALLAHVLFGITIEQTLRIFQLNPSKSAL